MAEIPTEWVSLQVADGTTMRAYFARPPKTPPRAGLLVFQEAFGVNAHIRDITERFAREGYSALAPELFHRTGPGFEGAYNNFEAAMPHVRALKEQDLEADARAAHTWLRENWAPRDAHRLYRVLHGWAGFLPHQFHSAGQGRRLLLRWRHRPNPMGPGLLNRPRFARATTFVLGWPGQPHWPRADTSGG